MMCFAPGELRELGPLRDEVNLAVIWLELGLKTDKAMFTYYVLKDTD